MERKKGRGVGRREARNGGNGGVGGGGRIEKGRDRRRQTDRQTECRVDIVRAVTLRKASTVLDLPKVMMVSSAWMCSRAWAAMFSTLKMPTFSRHVNITSWPQQRLLALLLATSHC